MDGTASSMQRITTQSVYSSHLDCPLANPTAPPQLMHDVFWKQPAMAATNLASHCLTSEWNVIFRLDIMVDMAVVGRGCIVMGLVLCRWV